MSSSTQHIFGSSGSEEGSHWISVSDLMAGLMVLFLFIAIAYIRPVAPIRGDLCGALFDEFKSSLLAWDAEIDCETLTVRFNSPEVLFDSGEANLKPRFKEILAEFFPQYLSILTQLNFKESIVEVRIEGHTSSKWEGAETEESAYFLNMKLSQDRTRAVLEHSLTLKSLGNKPDQVNWARDTITANGLSSSRLITMVDGSEDPDKSRRVEFRIRTKINDRVVRALQALEK